jgi:hypothetical protein
MKIQGFSGTAAEIREAVGQAVLMTGITIQQVSNGIPHIRVEPLIGNGLLWTDDTGETVGPHTLDVSRLSVKLGTGLGFDGSGAIQTTGTAGVTSLGSVTGDITLGSGLSMSGSVLTLDADLSAIAALAGTSGLLRKTAANTWTLDTASYSTVGHTHAYTDLTYSGLTTGQVLRATSATAAAFGALDLANASAVTGLLPIANGGTGLSSTSQNFFFAGPTSGAGAPSWRAIVAGDIPTLNQNTTGSAATLTTTRTIWGQNFNGSANVTGALSSVTDITMTGALALTGNTITVRAAATQDGVIIAGRAGGTLSYDVTISPTTLTADRTLTLADANTILTAGTMVATTRSITINGTTNQITSSAGAQDLSADRTWTLSLPQNIHTGATPTFAGLTLTGNASVTGTVTALAAATQDAVRLQGRAGGTGSFVVTLTPTTLSASRTVTLADGDTTLVAGTMVPTTGTGATGTWGISISGSAATLTTTRTLWGQNFNGSANVTGSLTSVGDITGSGAMALTATSGVLSLVATGAFGVQFTMNSILGGQFLTDGTFQANVAANVYASTGSSRVLNLRDSSGTVDAREWSFRIVSGSLDLRSVSDANTTQNTVLTLGRSGGLTLLGNLTGTAAMSVTATAGTLTLAATGANTILLQTNGTTALTISATQTATFAGAVTVSTGGIAVTGNSTIAGNLSSVVDFTNTGTANLAQSATTGQVNIGTGSGSGQSMLAIRGAAGQLRTIEFQTGSSSRWIIRADNTAESGSDAGSTFRLLARTDAGAAIDDPLVFTRAANGTMSFGGGGRMVQINSGAAAFAAVAGLFVRGSYNTSSGTARGMRVESTLNPLANNDTLYGVDIAPTYTNASGFTGLTYANLRVAQTYSANGANHYGILVAAVSGGTTNNYAIYTLGGGVRLDAGTLRVGGTFTPLSAEGSAGVLFNATLTATGGVARAQYITTVLTAAANNDVLTGLMVTPAFTIGGFTGTTAHGLYISSITGAATNYALYTNAGLVRFGGAVTIASGGLTVSASGAAITGDSSITGILTVNERINAGTASSATSGGVVLSARYSSGDIAMWGTAYSSGGPVMAYALTPKTSGTGLEFVSGVSTTSLARGAYTISGSQHYWHGAAAQSVTAGTDVTMTEMMTIAYNTALRLNGSTQGNAGDIALRRSASDGYMIVGDDANRYFGLSTATALFGSTITAVRSVSNNIATSGASAQRWSNVYSVLGNFSGDVTIGSLGVFDSATAPSTGMFMAYNLSNDSKWKGVNVQLSYTSSDTVVGLGADSTAYSYVYETGRAGNGTTPAAPGTVTLTPGHLSNTLDWSTTTTFDVATHRYRVQYSTTGAFAGEEISVYTTSRKFVHSRLVNGTTYYYRVAAQGATSGTPGSFSANTVSTPTSATASRSSETAAFGSIIAGEIAVANLSAITANLGRITGTGIIQNNSSDSATRTGIRFSSGYSLPSGWTGNPTSAYYMDFAATGGASDSQYLHLGSALRVYTDGSATFAGALTGTAVTASAGLFVGSGTLVSDQAILNVPAAARSMLMQSTGTLTDALVRDLAVRGVAVKSDNLEIYDRTYDGTATSATAGPPGTISDSGAAWALNQWAGARDSQPCEIKIVSGTGSGAEWYQIASNTATAITIVGGWANGTPASGSVYQIRGVVNGLWGNYTATVGGTLVAYLDDTVYSGGDGAAGTWDDATSSAQRTSFTVGTTTATARNNRLEAASSLPANGNQYTIRYKHRCDASGVTCNTGSMRIYGRTKVQYSVDSGTPPTTGWTDLVVKTSTITIPAGEVGYDTGTTEYTDTFTITGVTSTLWIRVVTETEYANTFTASGTGATTYGTGVHVSYQKTTSGVTVTRRSLRLWPTANLHNNSAVSYAPNLTLEPLGALPSTSLAIRGDIIMIDGGTPSTTLPYFFDGTNWQSMKSATPGTHGREAHTVNLVPTNGTLSLEGDFTYNTTTDRFTYHDGTTTRSLLRREGDTMSGNLTVSTGGITITGNSTIAGTLGSVTDLSMTGALSGATTGSFSTSVTTPILTQAGAMTIRTTAANDLTFQRNSTTFMTGVANGLQINSASLGVNVAPNATDGRIDASDDIVAFSSDQRLKTAVEPITQAMAKIMSLTAMTYNWNARAAAVAGFNTTARYVGLFAQEVQAVLPEAVKLAPFDNDGYDRSISGEHYLTVQYEKVVPLLVAGQQEGYRLIGTIHTKVRELEERIDALEQELSTLRGTLK